MANKVKIGTVGFDHGYHVELPIPLELDTSKLNSNIAIRIAEIFVHEINALLKEGGCDKKVSWKKNPKPESPKKAKEIKN